MLTMKHATPLSLYLLQPLLLRIRAFAGLKEKKAAVFYYKSKAFLHFHEDASGLYADVRIKEKWLRLPVNTFEECNVLIEAISKELVV